MSRQNSTHSSTFRTQTSLHQANMNVFKCLGISMGDYLYNVLMHIFCLLVGVIMGLYSKAPNSMYSQEGVL